MAESPMDHVVANLRENAARYYPSHSELRNVRVVGHTPKSDHYIYDIVIDFADGSERAAAKVYRPTKKSNHAADLAAQELNNLRFAFESPKEKNLAGIPRPLGDFSQSGVVVAEKLNGLPLQSIVMKAALFPGYSDHGLLTVAARYAGEWLKKFHKATAEAAIPFERAVCRRTLRSSAPAARAKVSTIESIAMIQTGTRSMLGEFEKDFAGVRGAQ